jgi:GH18 family chitinase
MAMKNRRVYGFIRHWDFASDTPYLYNPSILVFISYEDVASIGLKVDYALSKNLRGIMYWSMDADTRSSRLQRLIRAKLYPPSIASIGWDSADGGAPGVGLSWHAVADQTYHVWCTTNLLQDRWMRATWVVDETGQTRPEVVGANDSVYLIDSMRASRMFYQIRLP